MTVVKIKSYIGMSVKRKQAFFICQLSAGFLKVVLCLRGRRTEFLDFGTEGLSGEEDSLKLTEKAGLLLKRAGFNHEPVILCLPHHYVTCRYLKVPSQRPAEIERIIALQAPRFLPYPEDSLITGYQLISVDAAGYACINLVIAHKDAVERLVSVFGAHKPRSLKIYLGVYGLCLLYNHLYPQDTGPALLVDVDNNQAELAIVANHKLLFSRQVKLAHLADDWRDFFIQEVRKTERGYFEEVDKQKINKIVLLGQDKIAQELASRLRQDRDTGIQVLSCADMLGGSQCPPKLGSMPVSFAGLLGLGFGQAEESLNLVPLSMRREERKISRNARKRWLSAYISAIILLTVSSSFKIFENKNVYLNRLRAELRNVSKEARPLEDMEKKFKILQSPAYRRQPVLELVSELHRVLKNGIFLIDLNFEDNKELLLHGYARELDLVFESVTALKKSPVFKNFEVKVKYAANKRTSGGDIVDFEIILSKR